MSTGSLFTTSPTATSSLFFGFATYGFLGLAVGMREGGDLCCVGNDKRGARPHVDCELDVEGRGRLRLDLPVDRPASEYAGELARVPPVCARGRDSDPVDGSGRLGMGGVASELFEVVLFVRCLDENVVPYSDPLLFEPDMGPETERDEEAIDIRLELRVCVAVLAEGPEAARRALGFGDGGARNLGEADSLEKLLFLSRLCRGRGTSKLALTRGLSVGLLKCDELLMTEARLLRPELITLDGRDFWPLIRSSAIASNSDQVCRIRSCSAGTRLSSDKVRARVFIRERTSRV